MKAPSAQLPLTLPHSPQETHSHSGDGGRFIAVVGMANGCCSWQPFQPDAELQGVDTL